MHMPSTMPIGVLARQTGCTVPTIRYYEEIGLLPVAARTDSGQRIYGSESVERLTFVRHCRDLGFSVDAVRELISLVDHPAVPCGDVREIAYVHLNHVREKQRELRALELSLTAFVESCDAACLGGAAADCTILDALVRPRPDAEVAGNACCSGRLSSDVA